MEVKKPRKTRNGKKRKTYKEEDDDGEEQEEEVRESRPRRNGKKRKTYKEEDDEGEEEEEEVRESRPRRNGKKRKTYKEDGDEEEMEEEEENGSEDEKKTVRTSCQYGKKCYRYVRVFSWLQMCSGFPLQDPAALLQLDMSVWTLYTSNNLMMTQTSVCVDTRQTSSDNSMNYACTATDMHLCEHSSNHF